MRRRVLLVWGLLGGLVVLLYLFPCPAPAFELQPESLSYSVDVLFFNNAAQATISLKQVGPDCYEGEIQGHARGIVGLLSGHRRDRYRTLMRYTQGKLLPLKYWEESWRRGRHHRKEYRFDYTAGRLELWQHDAPEPARLKWKARLAEPIYDPISAFYNFRLGALGEIKGGETIVVSGIPYPQPEEIVIHIGPIEKNQRKVAVAIRNRAFENESGIVHIRFDPQRVPVLAWTRVLAFGKISGYLVTEPNTAEVDAQTLFTISQEWPAQGE